jgi:hypothetical protein
MVTILRVEKHLCNVCHNRLSSVNPFLITETRDPRNPPLTLRMSMTCFGNIGGKTCLKLIIARHLRGGNTETLQHPAVVLFIFQPIEQG